MNDVDEFKSHFDDAPSASERLQSWVTPARAKQLIEENRDPSKQEVQSLREEIAATYDSAIVELAEEEELDQVAKLLVSANKKISPKSGKVSLDVFLRAEKEFRQGYVILERVREQQKADEAPGWAVIAVAIGYPILIFILGMLPLPEKTLGLPTLVFTWGLFGGYVAVIFRHLLQVQERWKFEFMWLWVVIRPLLGAIMGAVLYQALVTGVMLFTTQINLEWISDKPVIFFIAFLGGLSEKFWSVLITAVLGPAQRKEEQASES